MAGGRFRWPEIGDYAVAVSYDRKEGQHAFGMPKDVELVGIEPFEA